MRLCATSILAALLCVPAAAAARAKLYEARAAERAAFVAGG